ncbi:MAG: HD domain-containing protein [Alphaproteobacteria bacterium]|nr:HD domain-containing protein [Alphaproteobacteria bacterium]
MESHIELSVPPSIVDIINTLKKNGHQAYCVGGCVRNIIMNIEPKDWDITTDALPEQIQSYFEHTVYENTYGTVGIVNDNTNIANLNIVEVTPYRKESNYSDGRRPDNVSFNASLSDDLKRRDFTVNALAYDPTTYTLIDEHEGIQHLTQKFLVAVGDPHERFKEDALRLLRGVRLATELSFTLEEKTEEALIANAKNIQHIAVERVRDELVKIIESDAPMLGIMHLEQVGLLEYIIPELRDGIGIDQNQAHSFDVFEHNLRTLEHAGVKKLPLDLRLAALFHDVSKPETRAWSEDNKDWTFYIHEVVGAKRTKKILERLKFSYDLIERVVMFVRWHMFFSDPDQLSLSGVRRMIARVGKEKIWQLIDLRMCDRIGTGRPKEEPYRLRQYQSMVEEVLRDPITPGILALDGNDLMQTYNLQPGKKIGNIISALLGETLENPEINKKEILLARAKELLLLDQKTLEELADKGRFIRDEIEEQEIEAIKKKNRVR